MSEKPRTDEPPAGTQRDDVASQAVPGEHLWQPYNDRIRACRWCGVVRRRDDANKPCKGVVPVELRRASPATP